MKELGRKDETGVAQDEATRWQISRWKNDLLKPEEAIAAAEDAKALAQAQLYARYQRQLKAYNAVDFDDLIMQPVRLLQGLILRKGFQLHLLSSLLIYQNTAVPRKFHQLSK